MTLLILLMVFCFVVLLKALSIGLNMSLREFAEVGFAAVLLNLLDKLF